MTEIFAHRGLHTEAVENTVRAFLEARAIGCDGVELDVRRSADGALVIHHDPEVAGLGAISQLTCRQLPEGLATLEEAMIACEGITVNVEIKNHPSEDVYDDTGALAHQVVAELDELGRLGSVIISSFDLATCEAVRSASDQVPVGWLLDWREDPAPSVATALDRGLSAIHPFFHGVDAWLVDAAHSRGLAVNVWTVNGADEMARLLALDVDALITDEPVLAQLTVAELGRSS